jgi:hypothetical protein
MNRCGQFLISQSGARPDMPRVPVTPRPSRTAAWAIDARLAWIVLALMIFSLPFIKEGDLGVFGATIAATVACLLALASVGYELTSFVSIVALTHFLFFPVAVWGNLLLPEMVVRWDLWVSSDLAMWGCAAGVLALGLGAFISGRLVTPIRKNFFSSRTSALPSFKFNLMLVLLIVPICLVQLFLGLYYHSAITESKMQNLFYVNLITMAQFISHAGIFLQTFRYCRTRSPRDGYWAIAFCMLHIIILMPSGSRTGALAFFPLLVLAYLKWESNTWRKVVAVMATLVLIPALIYGMGKYRGLKYVEFLSFNEKLDTSLQTPLMFYTKGGRELIPLAEVISRFSDYAAVGRIIAYTPDSIPYRGGEQLEKLWQIFVPGFLKLIPDRINLNDGADLCDLYGITKSRFMTGTSPSMIIGDLFSRWGWVGVALGMALIGFILRQIDLRLLRRWDTFTVLFFVLFGRYVMMLVSSSLINVAVVFTRELLVMALVAYALARWSNLESPCHNPAGRLPVPRRFSGRIEHL